MRVYTHRFLLSINETEIRVWHFMRFFKTFRVLDRAYIMPFMRYELDLIIVHDNFKILCIAFSKSADLRTDGISNLHCNTYRSGNIDKISQQTILIIC
jgi:hypothetical protein